MAEPQGPQKWYVKLLNFFLCASNDPKTPKKTCGRKCIECLKPTVDEPEEQVEGPGRESWGNRCTFFVSTLGMAVGLGQVWRFPTLAYSLGGGAFLIIYGVMIFLFGNALFFFEISNGQYSSKNPLLVYDKVPLFIGVGWTMISYSYIFCTYYSHMVSFAIFYFFKCFTANLPWTYCPSEDDSFYDNYTCVPYPINRDPELDGIVCGTKTLVYNHSKLCENSSFADTQKQKCCSMAGVTGNDCDEAFDVFQLCRPREYPSSYFWNHVVNRVYRKGDPKHGYLGAINYWLLICSFISWFLSYLTLYKGLKSLGVMMYILVPLPYIILVIMFGVVIPQNGASYGLREFFVPKAKSFIDINVWRVATEQAFYSLGVAMGPLITFGSYSKFENPCHIDGVLICLCIFLTSVLCSLVVFSILGFLSKKTQRPFGQVAEIGPGLVFIVYPESLDLLPGSQFFSALFYFMLMNLGLSSVTGIIETVSSAIYDIWPRTRKFKYLVNLGILSSCFIIGIPITARGGIEIYNVVDYFAAGMTLTPICALELFIIVYIYGLGRFCEDLNFMLGFYPYRIYRYQWMIGPFVLIAIFTYSMVVADFPDGRAWSIALGWVLFVCVMGWIFAGMIYTTVKYKKKGIIKEVLKAPPEHGPRSEAHRAGRENFSVKRKIF